MTNSKRLMLGLVLVSLAGCDRAEKPAPKPLDSVPPAVLADGKIYELTVEGYRELKYLPPLELDLSDRSYTSGPPGLKSEFEISYFNGKALVSVAVTPKEIDGLSEAEAWEKNKEQYAGFMPDLVLGARIIDLEFKKFDSYESYFGGDDGAVGARYIWEYRMTAEQFSKISNAQMGWREK